jgi:hypothetical protein
MIERPKPTGVTTQWQLWVLGLFAFCNLARLGRRSSVAARYRCTPSLPPRDGLFHFIQAHPEPFLRLPHRVVPLASVFPRSDHYPIRRRGSDRRQYPIQIAVLVLHMGLNSWLPSLVLGKKTEASVIRPGRTGSRLGSPGLGRRSALATA